MHGRQCAPQSLVRQRRQCPAAFAVRDDQNFWKRIQNGILVAQIELEEAADHDGVRSVAFLGRNRVLSMQQDRSSRKHVPAIVGKHDEVSRFQPDRLRLLPRMKPSPSSPPDEMKRAAAHSGRAVLPGITVKKSLQGVLGVSDVSIDFAKKTARVTYDANKVKSADLTSATTNAGYPSTVQQ